ncbi:MAG: CPBP family intramembrane metalloprotease [Actinomycetota bacterium]|nr:CPBP family intramembrane metalloprotease [Actinomycetota bacterium]
MDFAADRDFGEVKALGSTLWGLALALVASNVFAIIYILVDNVTSTTTISTGELIVSSVGVYLGFLGAPLLVARRQNRRLTDLFHISFKAIDVVIGIVVGVGLQLAVVPLLYLPLEALSPSIKTAISQPAQRLTSSAHGFTLDTLIVGLILVGFSPLLEEIFFRGLAWQSLMNFKISNKYLRVAVVNGGSALLFAAAHFEPLQTLGLFVVGLVFAAMRYRFNRLGPTVVAHAAFNFITFATMAKIL